MDKHHPRFDPDQDLSPLGVLIGSVAYFAALGGILTIWLGTIVIIVYAIFDIAVPWLSRAF